jgi:cellulose synthase/poly-beta-1,6-N-acetylglucosamine synthase-like glycosyltransferase
LTGFRAPVNEGAATTPMVSILLAVYFFALGVLALFGLHRLDLVRRARAAKPPALGAPLDAAPPAVLLQLPLYNEAFVAERALRAAAGLDYPRDRLRVQVLDDSTDETRAIVDRTVADLVRSGHRIEVLRRPDRVGWKAGALAAGMSGAPEPLIAILDADFVPPPEFLERTVRMLLADPGLGLVQARWGHLNRGASWLTRAQAVFLDAHFGIEQRARCASGALFNFNGTAGLWRRAAIEDGGGWSADTLTEDLDLSYRAQLAGWRFGYLDALSVPGELPEGWAAFRGQQARWARGSVETARKLLGRVLRSPRLSRAQKLEAALHLSTNLAYVLMALLALLLPAVAVLRATGLVPTSGALDALLFAFGTGSVLVFDAAALLARPRRGGVLDLVFALLIGAGICLSNAREVLLAFAGRRAEFRRTPKRGDASAKSARARYRADPRLWLASFEALLAVVHLAAFGSVLRGPGLGTAPFLLLYAIGLSASALGSLAELAGGATPAPAGHLDPSKA